MPPPRALRTLALAASLPLLASTWACSSVPLRHPDPTHTERGTASWYGKPFDGRPTASGETYDMDAYTAAHRELPFGSLVEVTNLENGRTVRLRINDRGPFVDGRMIDVSRAAARELDMVGPGTARVEIKVVGLAASQAALAYMVQAGAFREGERAAALLERLRERHAEARIEFDGLWHRVEIGPFKKRKRAEGVAAELTGEGVVAFVKAEA